MQLLIYGLIPMLFQLISAVKRPKGNTSFIVNTADADERQHKEEGIN